MDFEKKKTAAVIPELTSKIAMEIFNSEGDPSQIFKNPDTDFHWEHVLAVYAEGVRLRAAIDAYMSGGVVLTPPEVDVETGELIEAIFWVPSTKTKLKKELTSEILDILDVLDDKMEGQSWDQFKAGYEVE